MSPPSRIAQALAEMLAASGCRFPLAQCLAAACVPRARLEGSRG